ncbi:tubulin-specific chaperone C [Coccinella septempunctata]|uniref:tubulin-specific chaperone C n=1 Tax=Coccinella septempunctata TaxID=41139 RepID=UPI001D08A062|nr:tubulin-specific chaperone C [Coccinella septempunctata]
MATREQDKISLIFKRDSERKENIKKQKDLKELNSAHNEKIDYFIEEFSTKCSEIENLQKICSNVSACELAEHFNVIFKKISILQKYVADSNLFLRTYDIKKCNDILHHLTEKTKELEDNLLPKKRFGFKNKARLTSKAEKETITSKDVTDFAGKSYKLQLSDVNSVGFSNKSNEILDLENEEIFKKNIDVFDSSDCTFKILGSPSTLHLHALKNCVVISGPVSTSIFASNCENCTLVIACQQLRLHSSKQLKIYLHVTSRAIIEDCSEILVAPYKLKYKNIGEHFEKSGLGTSNNWQSIDDFNWLKANEQSPNWAFMEEKDRIEWTV